MLFLIFQVGPDRYALDAACVNEVLPLIGITTMPRAPAGVAGLLNSRGTPVPVIDLSELMLGQPARRCLSTRIVMVRSGRVGGDTRIFGLIAERATETLQRPAADFVPSGLLNSAAPYLGPVATDARGLLQRIDIETLLPAVVKDVLFSQALAQ